MTANISKSNCISLSLSQYRSIFCSNTFFCNNLFNSVQLQLFFLHKHKITLNLKNELNSKMNIISWFLSVANRKSLKAKTKKIKIIKVSNDDKQLLLIRIKLLNVFDIRLLPSKTFMNLFDSFEKNERTLYLNT
jgi:hypothetical protein